MQLSTPIIIVNFKTYKEATGDKAVSLAKDIQKAGIQANKNVAVAVEAEDIRLVAMKVNIPVLAQHMDVEGFGANTGSIIAEGVKAAGAIGSLINHSEHQISDDEIQKVVEKCKELGMISIVCANTVEDSERLSKFSPDFIAIEPHELIGGDVSVSKAKPEVITDSVAKVSGPVLCGAGVNSAEDVSVALKLGAKGILIASAVVKAENPYEKMLELLGAL